MADSLADVKTSTICLLFTALVYLGISKVIFDNIYITSHVVVDEEFHLPLGQAYCELDFTRWDPKVTTLPGLYLVSSFVLQPFATCSTYALRFVSLLASVANIFLFYDLFFKYEKNEWRNILSAVTLALIPPLYFFSHLYYTDVVSLTMVLTMLVLYDREYHYYASVFGFASVICRQTNIIWVGLVTGRYILAELYKVTMQKHLTRGKDVMPAKNFNQFFTQLKKKPKHILLHMPLQFWLDVSGYISVLVTFAVFIVSNGSIVVGDKTAHEATIHIPQLFYFSIFCMVFAWPHFVGEVINFTCFAKRHKLLTLSCMLICAFVVFANTLVHPYLLADNRHYIFYVWNRFYGKYPLFRYYMVPVYVFAWYAIIKMIYDRNDVTFIILYLPCVVAILVTQKLIDIRYYFIPYIIFRLRVKNNTSTVFNVILEFVTFCVMNTITLNLFFTKTIMWDDNEVPQRLIW